MILQAQLHHADGFEWIVNEAFNAYSQYGEDGIIAGLARRFGLTNKVFVDVGAGDGIQYSNTRALAEHGCTGYWFEACHEAHERSKLFLPDGVQAIEKFVRPYGPDCLDVLLPQLNVPREFDLLSLDIDGYEWHVWNCMIRHWPRFVICEYNPGIEGQYTVCPQGDGTEPYEQVQPASKAIELLACSKGYNAVIRTHTNVIAVRRDVWYEFMSKSAARKESDETA